jgi:hypothetical protein
MYPRLAPGAMPSNVSLHIRPMIIAGLAKLIELAAIHRPISARFRRTSTEFSKGKSTAHKAQLPATN